MTSALLVMDVQQGVVERFGQPGVLDRLAEGLAAARNAGVAVIFVRVAFRPGFPEVRTTNRSFSALVGTAGDRFGEDNPATQIHPRWRRALASPSWSRNGSAPSQAAT